MTRTVRRAANRDSLGWLPLVAQLPYLSAQSIRGVLIDELLVQDGAVLWRLGFLLLGRLLHQEALERDFDIIRLSARDMRILLAVDARVDGF